MKPVLFLAILSFGLAAPAFAGATAPASSPYPLDTCVVSGEALGSMGDPYVHVHKEEGKPDREVRFCCKGCLKRFNKEPAKYLQKLDTAAQSSSGKTAAPAPAPAADAHAGHGH